MDAKDPSFLKEVDTFLRKLGIGYAGPVPSSLLSRQDLEGSTRSEKSFAKTEKGAVETTGKQLDSAVRAAEKAEDTEEKDDLASRIKNIQLRRQKATIAERSKEAVGKGQKPNFKAVWGALTNKVN